MSTFVCVLTLGADVLHSFSEDTRQNIKLFFIRPSGYRETGKCQQEMSKYQMYAINAAYVIFCIVFF